MPNLSLSQAAKACKKSKSTIHDSIKSGRLSAKRNELGQWEIDPAELSRVFAFDPSELHSENRDRTHAELANERDVDRLENSLLKQHISSLERLVAHLEDERDDLRTRLDKSEGARENAANETRRLTLLITDQSERGKPTPLVRTPFWVALVVILIGAAATWPWWAWMR